MGPCADRLQVLLARLRAACGQASLEHVGLIALVALVAAAAVAIVPRGSLLGALGNAICRAAGAGCPDSALADSGSPSLMLHADARQVEAELSRRERRDLVDEWMSAELEGFLAYRSSEERDPRLDYSTNECSAPLVGSVGRSFDFTDACLRHDFGYRNYGRIGIFEQRKEGVDRRFLADMRDHCETRTWILRGRCRAWAEAFYLAVDRFGWISGHGRS